MDAAASTKSSSSALTLDLSLGADLGVENGPDLADAPLVARVVPDVTGIDRAFDYLVPESMRDRVGVGSMVRAPLAGRRIAGWVVALGASDVAVDKLRPLTKYSGHGPSAELIELAEWASVRWAGPLRAFLVTASPPGAVLGLGAPTRHPAPRAPLDPVAVQALDAGGGVLRLPPTADPVPVVLAACARGPVLAITPTIAQARLTAARLRRSGRSVALMPTEWAAAAAGVDVVIGARAAVWAPCPGLATIVVLDEHDESLQEQRQPTWHARDVAIERARRAGAAVLAVSASPSITALTDVRPAILTRPAVVDERAGWPIVEIVDRTRDEPWKTSLVTSELIRQLRDRERIVACVLNTTGRARLLACRTCRSLQRCERCEAAVQQRDDHGFHCQRCGEDRPPVCQACGASAFAALRLGVTRLREELEAAAARPVIAVSGADHEPVAEAGVYVGTEAVLHRIRRADTVAFLDFDAELLAPRYRATEQAMTLLTRAARLVGGRAGAGRILVQTFVPRHPVLDAALHADPGRLAATELARRRELLLPPAAALARISGAGAEEFGAALAGERVRVTATLEGPVLVRADDWDALGAALAATPRPSGSRVRIEVDPARL